MTFHKRGLLVWLHLTILTLVSFSQPAAHQAGLVLMPEAAVLTQPDGNPAHIAVQGTSGPPMLTLRATAYNSLPSQTWGDPNITATGEPTRFGIIAASRDLIGSDLPYGSLVRIRDQGGFGNGRGAGQFQETLDGQGLFIVEDTMHIRKQQQVDVWFPELSTALSWGVRQVELEVVRYGRDGPVIGDSPAPVLSELPAFAAPAANN